MVEWVVGGLGLGLFGYNRKNFMFDSEQKVRREFQGQNMRIKRFELYREDVRDLVDLTVSKMDNYLVVGTLQLGFTVRFFCEGHPLRDKMWPSWLIWFWAVANIGAFMYLALSMWLAMHASIAAHSFGVRMLTQFVRLPVATRQELDAATAKAEDYEQAQLQDLVRLPLLKQQLRRLNAAMASDTASQSDEGAAGIGPEAPEGGGGEAAPGLSSLSMQYGMQESTVDLEHIVLYRQAQENWQAYDAYARVCMAMGTNQLLCALGFYCLGLLIVEIQAPITALCVTIVLQVSALLIVMLDVYDCEGWATFKIAAALLLTHGFFSWLGTLAWSLRAPGLRTGAGAFVPLSFLLHASWIAFMMHVAGPRDSDRVALPAKFRSVLYLDVFGWLPGPHSRRREAASGDSASSGAPALGLLRDSLRQLCQRLHSELQRDLACWEGQDVADQPTFERIEALRDRLQARSADLEGISPSVLEQPPHDASPAARVWLKLELSTSGRTVDFFLERGTGEVRCTPPLQADRILDLGSLERQLLVFEEKVRALAQFPQEPQPPPSQGALVHPPVLRSDSGSTEATLASMSHGHGIRVTSPAPDDGQGEHQGSFQRQGSFQLTENARPGQDFLAPSATVAATFNPHEEGRTAETEGSRAHRPPGHMPWRTFRTASITMVAIWLSGALWCTVLVLANRSHVVDILPGMRQLTTWRRDTALLMEPLETVSAPHRFFRPAGLACHPAAGPVLFVVEKYAIHEVHLDSEKAQRGTEPRQALLRECLAAAPDFAAGGMRGAHLDCAPSGEPGSRCEMVLLSASGQAALRCPMPPLAANDLEAIGRSSSENSHVFPSQRMLKPLTLHGGPWRSLLAAPGGSGMWALDDSNLVQMHQRLGFHDELVPQLVLPHGIPKNASRLHMLGNGAVLALDSAGWLHAWGREGGRSAPWRLLQDVQWSGVCADSRSVYLLGTAAVDGSVMIWRTALPPELAVP